MRAYRIPPKAYERTLCVLGYSLLRMTRELSLESRVNSGIALNFNDHLCTERYKCHSGCAGVERIGDYCDLCRILDD